jgi:hypothetical protein
MNEEGYGSKMDGQRKKQKEFFFARVHEGRLKIE